MPQRVSALARLTSPGGSGARSTRRTSPTLMFSQRQRTTVSAAAAAPGEFGELGFGAEAEAEGDGVGGDGGLAAVRSDDDRLDMVGAEDTPGRRAVVDGDGAAAELGHPGDASCEQAGAGQHQRP